MWGVTFGGYVAKILSFKSGNLLYKSNFYLFGFVGRNCVVSIQISCCHSAVLRYLIRYDYQIQQSFRIQEDIRSSTVGVRLDHRFWPQPGHLHQVDGSQQRLSGSVRDTLGKGLPVLPSSCKLDSSLNEVFWVLHFIITLLLYQKGAALKFIISHIF